MKNWCILAKGVETERRKTRATCTMLSCGLFWKLWWILRYRCGWALLA